MREADVPAVITAASLLLPDLMGPSWEAYHGNIRFRMFVSCPMQAGSVQSELAESKQALEAARSEVECLREMVTSWEEAFGKAQQELDGLKVRLHLALVFWRKMCKAVMMPVRRRELDCSCSHACIPASVIRLMQCAKHSFIGTTPEIGQALGRNSNLQGSQPLSKPWQRLFGAHQDLAQRHQDNHDLLM